MKKKKNRKEKLFIYSKTKKFYHLEPTKYCSNYAHITRVFTLLGLKEIENILITHEKISKGRYRIQRRNYMIVVGEKNELTQLTENVRENLPIIKMKVTQGTVVVVVMKWKEQLLLVC